MENLVIGCASVTFIGLGTFHVLIPYCYWGILIILSPTPKLSNKEFILVISISSLWNILLLLLFGCCISLIRFISHDVHACLLEGGVTEGFVHDFILF